MDSATRPQGHELIHAFEEHRAASTMEKEMRRPYHSCNTSGTGRYGAGVEVLTNQASEWKGSLRHMPHARDAPNEIRKRKRNETLIR